MLFLQVLLIGQVKKIDVNSKTEREIWNKLTEQERWESFVIEHNSYIELKKIYDGTIIREEIILQEYEKTNNILKKQWNPKSAISMNIMGGINERLRYDIIVSINYNIYLYGGRMFISPDIYVKIYDEIGGGLGVGIGVSW